MNVPFLELKPTYLELKEELDVAYHRVMDSGWYLLGNELEDFEHEFARYCEVQHCVGVGSGLDALHLALRACGVDTGDEVIVPSHTFIATWLAASYAGATPVPVEPDLFTYNLDPTRIESAITSRTRAIVPVHLYGQPANMDPILEIATKHGLYVVEDAAQSQGARYKGRRTGGLGHIAAHSFYPAKNLGAFSDSGAITTNDAALAERVRLLRNYGSREKYHYEIKGFNSRMDELQAAFLRVKLSHLDNWNQRRVRIASTYVEALASILDVVVPTTLPDVEPVWHLFVVRHHQRDELRQALHRSGIGTQIHYPISPHLSDAYKTQSERFGPLPIAEQIAGTVFSLPIGPHLTNEHTTHVADTIHAATTQLHPATSKFG